MSDRFNSLAATNNRVSSSNKHYQQHSVQCYPYQYSEYNGNTVNKTFLTIEELDYLENVISKNYTVVPSKGLVAYNGYPNNNNINSSINNVTNIVDSNLNSEPSFKGQLSKYFPESIRSNFNDVIDFTELKASELFVSSDNSFSNVVWNEFYDDSNETDVNSNNDILNSSPSSNGSNIDDLINQNSYARSNSTTTDESLDFTNQNIKKEKKDYHGDSINVNNINKSISNVNNIHDKISMVSRRRGIIKKTPKEKKIICMKDCLHVWEFLRDLLKDNRYNNHIIKWLDQKQGIFKILDPNSVSLLWGKKKLKKSDMKYPNMARGIRYSREEGGYFDSVSKSLGYGKKLVYKFSKKTLDHCEWLRSFITEY